MLDITRDVQSLSAFQRNTRKFVEQMHQTGNPLVLTVNGKADLVVLTAESYQRLYELADRMETLEGIRRGLDDVEAGRTMPLDEAFERIRREHGTSDSGRRDGTTGNS